MLTKDMKKTLDFLNRNSPDLQNRFYTVDYISHSLGYHTQKSYAICVSLSKEDFVSFADKQQTAILLLEKGINYKDLNKQDFYQFLKRSVIIPFLVSIATSLVTMYLTKIII